MAAAADPRRKEAGRLAVRWIWEDPEGEGDRVEEMAAERNGWMGQIVRSRVGPIYIYQVGLG